MKTKIPRPNPGSRRTHRRSRVVTLRLEINDNIVASYTGRNLLFETLPQNRTISCELPDQLVD
jgi:hypothetical protein